MTDPNWSPNGGRPGDVFVKSAAYQKISDPVGRGQRWTAGPVEVSSTHVLVKGTMLERCRWFRRRPSPAGVRARRRLEAVRAAWGA
jgi:hypothetical protein